ncbi:ABC transporter substrate-binding protein [Pasteurella testudinis]|uniref:ABC transporter substrate-binding protein n=1 Tax=Pasteurella testudinis TaxID=761 RepID=UPI0040596A47
MKKFLIFLLLFSGLVQAETLFIGKRHAPLSWDPIDSYTMFWGAVASNLYDGLVLRTETFELKPGLAQSWQILDDGLRFRFQLRQDVRFHNGEHFDAESVKFSFERLLRNEGNSALQLALYDSIKQVNVIDPYTIDFVLHRHDPSFLTKLAGYGGMIVPPNYIKTHGESHFDKNPVGTGPFKFVTSKDNDILHLRANPDYFAGQAKVEHLVFRFIADEKVRVREFLEGRLDVLQDLPFSDVPRVKNVKGVDVVAVKGLTVQTLQFNLIEPLMQDVRVRQALNLAVDKQALINMLLNGYGRPVAGLQTEMTFGYDPDLKIYPYDPAKAKALLQQAGVKAGEKLVINYRSSNYSLYEMARAVAVFFKDLDFKVELKPITQETYLRSSLMPANKNDEIFQFGWNGWTLDFGDSAYLLFHSGQAWNPLIHSPELDALLDQQRGLRDSQQRLNILREIADLAHQQAYYLPLFAEDAIYGVSDKVKNFIPAADGRMRYLTTEIQR